MQRSFARVIRIVVWLGGLAILGVGALATHSHLTRVKVSIDSEALKEVRHVTLYNLASSAPEPAIQIVSLDGEHVRHGLIPAVTARLLAMLGGETAPVIIAVHSMGQRDMDLRPDTVRPATWRPNIKGQSTQFDRFLLVELPAALKGRLESMEPRYLMGHSLGAFYALDLASRHADAFDGFIAFTPTFSHDLGLINRATSACDKARYLYVNIGLESDRELDLFGRFAEKPACQSARVTIEHHPGMIHQVVMLTGQISALARVAKRPG